MPPKEMVHWLVPLARELEPVAAIPPVGVELAIGEPWAVSTFASRTEGYCILTSDFRECSQYIFENDKENQ